MCHEVSQIAEKPREAYITTGYWLVEQFISLFFTEMHSLLTGGLATLTQILNK